MSITNHSLWPAGDSWPQVCEPDNVTAVCRPSVTHRLCLSVQLQLYSSDHETFVSVDDNSRYLCLFWCDWCWGVALLWPVCMCTERSIYQRHPHQKMLVRLCVCVCVCVCVFLFPTTEVVIFKTVAILDFFLLLLLHMVENPYCFFFVFVFFGLSPWNCKDLRLPALLHERAVCFPIKSPAPYCIRWPPPLSPSLHFSSWFWSLVNPMYNIVNVM